MYDVVDILNRVTTGDVIYDEFYRGYLYKVRDEYAIDPYLMYVINIATSIKHIHTPLMYKTLLHYNKPYLYFSRLYPDLIVLQYMLLDSLKNVEIPDTLKELIDNMSKIKGIFFFRNDTASAIYMRYAVAKMLENTKISGNSNVMRMLYLLKIQDNAFWHSITNVVRLPKYSFEQKIVINYIFQKRVFTDVEVMSSSISGNEYTSVFSHYLITWSGDGGY